MSRFSLNLTISAMRRDVASLSISIEVTTFFNWHDLNILVATFTAAPPRQGATVKIAPVIAQGNASTDISPSTVLSIPAIVESPLPIITIPTPTHLAVFRNQLFLATEAIVTQFKNLF